MNREIKFRHWDNRTNSWFYWGFLGEGMTSPAYVGATHYQYTGKKDKNGVEIYDGDIVRRLYIEPEYEYRCELGPEAFNEQVDTKFEWNYKEVKWCEDGFWNIAEDSSYYDYLEECEEHCVYIESDNEKVLNLFGLPKTSNGVEALEILNDNGFCFNSFEEVVQSNNCYEVIGNIHENPEILN